MPSFITGRCIIIRISTKMRLAIKHDTRCRIIGVKNCLDLPFCIRKYQIRLVFEILQLNIINWASKETYIGTVGKHSKIPQITRSRKMQCKMWAGFTWHLEHNKPTSSAKFREHWVNKPDKCRNENYTWKPGGITNVWWTTDSRKSQYMVKQMNRHCPQ